MTKRCGYIALAGRPNAGKSTFLNAVLGEKVSIVSDKPQTTRNRILGVYHGDDLQIGFFDLPGIHKPNHAMNRVMMRLVNQGVGDADLILHFIDVSVPLGSGDRFVHEMLGKLDIPIIVVANKMDLVNKSKVLPTLDTIHKEFQPKELIPISAKTGDNRDHLMSIIASYLPEGEFLFQDDMLTDQPIRFMAQELIREKILHYTREELPHAAAVAIESFQYDEARETYEIGAVIYIEKASQRRIVLGQQGSMISKIRRGAQRSLHELLKKPVELDLFVKVSENWRNNDRFLGEINLK
ncbi:GTPase Era [Sulfidibacter corallicola]|uniref:GTPase Era n=1 Tax=Sulfidibacter corallicola TaxID=2818388 RepID=A0A8A4TID4_SULCO|nr:GTPase Era [Sulfidibacter corallicola]QTD49257.1 GTPase Era [Sulfidibacter corallicola]